MRMHSNSKLVPIALTIYDLSVVSLSGSFLTMQWSQRIYFQGMYSRSTRGSSVARADVFKKKMLWRFVCTSLVKLYLTCLKQGWSVRVSESQRHQLWCALFFWKFYDGSFNHNWFWGNRKSLCVWCCGFSASYISLYFFHSSSLKTL